MRDIKSAVSRSLTNSGNPAWRNFGDFNFFETDDGSELFVEAFSKVTNARGNAVVGVSRLVALGVLEAVEDRYETIHVTTMFTDNVTRLTIDSTMFTLGDDELKARIAQSLRIS